MAISKLTYIQLTEYLHGLYLSAIDPHISTPLISAIPLLGLSHHIVPLLQAHLDTHGDIQTIALLAALIPSNHLSTVHRTIIERWTEAYRDILDSWRMFAVRVDFDVKRQEAAREFAGRSGTSEVVKGNCPV